MTLLCRSPLLFHLGGRVEHMFVYRKEVLHTVPCLHQHTQDAIRLAARRSCHALGHLLLYHARATGYQFLVLQHLEEDLARYVVGIVARQHEGLSVKQAVEVHFQEVILNDIFLQRGKIFSQVGHRFKVQLHHFQGPFLRDKELGEHAHTGSDLQHGQSWAGIHRVGYIFRYLQVLQEVLSEELLGFYKSHRSFLFKCRM